MEPISSKLLADLRRKSRRSIVDLTAIRQARQDVEHAAKIADETAAGLPPDYAFWMRALSSLAAFAFPLLGSPRLRKLAQRLEDSEERYMPGGPPMSPLTDSFHTFWSLADTTIGLKKESLTQIAIAVARAHDAPAALLDTWNTIASSYAGIYRIVARRGNDVSLQELITGDRFDVAMANNTSGRVGDLWWTRLLPPTPVASQPSWVSIATPYVIRGPGADRAWLDYFDRALQTAPKDTQQDAYHRLMKHGESPTFWFEFILDAYVGELECALELTGVPDKSDSLPHSLEHDELSGPAESNPLERLRRRLQTIARDHGLGQRAVDDFALARKQLTDSPAQDAAEWAASEQLMLTAHAVYSARDDDGHTALDLLSHTDPSQLPDDEQAAIDALACGWFSIFEVLRIKIGEGIELRDPLRRRRFWIEERSASRQVAIGDLLACWVMHEQDRWYLEGAVAHVPSLWATGALEFVRGVMKDLRKQRSLSWKMRHDRLPPIVSAFIAHLHHSPPAIPLANHHGHPLLLSEAIYEIREPATALAALAAAPELQAEPDDDEFIWVDKDKQVLIARIAVDDHALCVTTNSRERHDHARTWLENLLGESIVHRADTFSDPTSEALQDLPQPHQPDQELPPEVQAAMVATLQQSLHSWLDQPIPALGNKSPRQAVRSEKGRDDVSAMLLQQERLLKHEPSASELNFPQLWSELGLPYLGPPV